MGLVKAKLRKQIFLRCANGIHPIPQRRTALLPAHRPPCPKHDVGQFLAWLDFDEARSDPRSITADQVREWIIHRTEEGKIGASINEPRNRLNPRLLSGGCSARGPSRDRLPRRDPLAQDLAPPAGFHTRAGAWTSSANAKRRTGIRNGTQFAGCRPDVLRLRPAPCRTGRHRPRRLLGRLRLAAVWARERQGWYRSSNSYAKRL